MAPIRTNTQTERRNRVSNFDLDQFRRKIAAERYRNMPWFQSQDGLLVGELPPMTPEPGRWAAWEHRRQEEHRQRLQAEDAKNSKGLDRTETEREGDSVMVDSNHLIGIRESSTDERSDGWTKFVTRDKGACGQPIDILDDEDDADIEMKDEPNGSSSPVGRRHPPIDREGESERIKFETDPISPAKSNNSDAEKPAISSTPGGAPSVVPRPLAPNVPVKRRASEQPRPRTPRSTTAEEIYQHHAQNRTYPRYDYWRTRCKDMFDLAYADLENPNSTLNLAKRDRPWRVVQLGEQGMQNMVKSGPTRPGGRGKWERLCRVEKRTPRTI